MNCLPVEILENIFLSLNGKEAAACRAVCRRWRDVVDSFTERIWQHYCDKDFQNSKKAKMQSNLTYQQLYRALSLWDKVEEAEITPVDLPIDPALEKVSFFKLLYNNTLAVVTREASGPDSATKIQYYNTFTLEFIYHEVYPFRFDKYDENESLITFIMMDNNQHGFQELLVITIKSNNKKKVCHVLRDYEDFDPFCAYSMFSNAIYFVNTERNLCTARLTVVNCEDAIEIETLASWNENYNNIVAFADAGQTSINILTYTARCSTSGDIFVLNIIGFDNRIYNLRKVINRRTLNIISTLKEFGFQWNDPVIYECLKNIFDNGQSLHTALNMPIFNIANFINDDEISIHIHIHCNVVLVGTSKCHVHIFKRVYNNDGELELLNANANRTITALSSSRVEIIAVNQIDVLEILNGHRIIIVTDDGKLSIFDFLHERTSC